MRLRPSAFLAAAAILASGAVHDSSASASAATKATPASAPSSGVKPPPPPAEVPDLREVKPPVLCVNCDQPFDTITHKKVLEGLLNNPYISELRKALYLQDTYHQFESKAHFDNCDFDSAAAYITELLDETAKHVDAATKAKNGGDKTAMEAAILKAFFSLGQALHGTQDFYAHTNYVELHALKAKKVTDIPVLVPWRAEGRTRIKELQQAGLISGFVFWGAPQKCPSGTISHGNLAKDTATTKSGKVVVANLQNTSQYKIAVYLAREASLQLLNDAFKQWPLLKEVNGEAVALDVLVDRRGVDTP
ncbi:HET-C-related protein [Dokdonella sp.]|uniref:HET-C-related protein n=1 Tax=Dokdonella sp. TaxID=2291710 RepID=UPI002DD6AE25|nr:HET-C-related protein [Dokdonella sp.]